MLAVKTEPANVLLQAAGYCCYSKVYSILVHLECLKGQSSGLFSTGLHSLKKIGFHFSSSMTLFGWLVAVQF